MHHLSLSHAGVLTEVHCRFFYQVLLIDCRKYESLNNNIASMIKILGNSWLEGLMFNKNSGLLLVKFHGNRRQGALKEL